MSEMLFGMSELRDRMFYIEMSPRDEPKKTADLRGSAGKWCVGKDALAYASGSSPFFLRFCT